jgi:DNA-binding transcriptional LysR family regulator
LDLTRLRHILAVARNQSFSRAAEEQGITQPALSRSIAAFEQRHGVTLFDRGRGGVYPTAAGQLVVEHARALLASADDLERSLRGYGSGEAGRLAIGLGPLLASLLLPRLSGTLMRSRPGLQVSTLIRPPDQLITDLLGDKIEMILGNNWQLGRLPGTEVETLGRIRLAIMVRAAHPLAKARRASLADLEGYPAASAVDLPAGGLSSHAGAFVCDNFHILRETVQQTDCIWISSPAFVAQELRDGTLVQLPISDLAFDASDVVTVFRRGRTCSPAALAAAEEVRAMLEA